MKARTIKTKNAVIEKALELFAEKGYEGCTMNGIAGALGIKAASLYTHYSGKEEIFLSVLAHAMDEWTGLVSGIFAEAEKIPNLEKGLLFILGSFAKSISGSTAYRFWTRVYVFPPPVLDRSMHDRISNMFSTFETSLISFLTARISGTKNRKEAVNIGGSLTFFIMGILMFGSFIPAGDLTKRITEGVKLHLKSLSEGES